MRPMLMDVAASSTDYGKNSSGLHRAPPCATLRPGSAASEPSPSPRVSRAPQSLVLRVAQKHFPQEQPGRHVISPRQPPRQPTPCVFRAIVDRRFTVRHHDHTCAADNDILCTNVFTDQNVSHRCSELQLHRTICVSGLYQLLRNSQHGVLMLTHDVLQRQVTTRASTASCSAPWNGGCPSRIRRLQCV